MVIPAIEAARAPLQKMGDVESAEVAEMKDIQQTIDAFPTRQVNALSAEEEQSMVHEAAEQIELDTKKAAENEDRQQKSAKKSLEMVNNLIDGFHSRGVTDNRELGEGNGHSGQIHHALKELEEVSAALTADTATMNTKSKVERMHEEAANIDNEALSAAHLPGSPEAMAMGMPPSPEAMAMGTPDMPEGAPPMTATSAPGMMPPRKLGGAIGDLKDKVDQLKQAPPMNPMANAPMDPMDPMAMANAPMDPAMANAPMDPMDPMAAGPPGMPVEPTSAAAGPALIATEQKQFSKLYQQEGQVEAAEANDESEVSKLINKLS
jgi:hypothetical protein